MKNNDNCFFFSFLSLFYLILVIRNIDSDVIADESEKDVNKTRRSPQYYPDWNYPGGGGSGGRGRGFRGNGQFGGGGGGFNNYGGQGNGNPGFGYGNYGNNGYGNNGYGNNGYGNNGYGNNGYDNNGYQNPYGYNGVDNNGGQHHNRPTRNMNSTAEGGSHQWRSHSWRPSSVPIDPSAYPPPDWRPSRHGNGWRPNRPHFHPPPPFGFSGYRPVGWGNGGDTYDDRGDRKRRISQIKFEEYWRRIYGDEDYDENDILKPEDLNGREVAKPGEYPHVAAIGIRVRNEEERRNDWKCTGALISENFVITAAHCTSFGGQPPTHVKIGDINLNIREDLVAAQRSRIENIFVHPNYRGNAYYFDIALIKMAKPVVWTRHVRPARLWVDNEIPFEVAFAMGYGATQFGKAPTDVLTFFNLTIMGNDECNKTLPAIPETAYGIVDSQICAIDKTGHRDTCQGDSGGPLQLHLPGRRRIRFYVIGITSYGLICGNNQPSVYTRVSSFIDWIEQIVWGNQNTENNNYNYNNYQ